MKAQALFAGLFLLVSAAMAEVNESPFYRVGTPTAVSVSTSAYTKTPTSRTLSSISGVYLDNPSTNSAAVHGHLGNCTSTSISTSTVKGPIEIPAANGQIWIPLSDGVCLWLVSRHTAAESVTVQEASQRYGP